MSDYYTPAIVSNWSLSSAGDIIQAHIQNSSPRLTVVQARLESLQALDPIYAIPVDILAYIFHIGTHSDEDDGIQFPILVSHVCRSWRCLALNSSTLWTNISISSGSIGQWDSFPTGPVLPKASSFAFRSQGCPLSIKIDLLKPHLPTLREEVVPLVMRLLSTATIEFIASVHDRVRALDISTDMNDTVFMATYRLFPLGLPMLESLHIYFGEPKDSFERQTWDVPNQDFAEFDASGLRGGWLGTQDTGLPVDALLPHLKELQLYGVRATWNQWSIGNLTSLSLNYMAFADRPSGNQLREVLVKNAGSLVNLELCAMLPPNWASDQTPPIVLPRLRKLRVGYGEQIEAISFLLALEVPSLKSLALCDVPRSFHHSHRRVLTHSHFAEDIPIDLTIPSFSLEQDFDSTLLLCSLSRRCRALLSQIETLELIHVLLIPRPALWVDNFFAGQVTAQFLCPIEFIAAMPSLRTLILNGPDPAMLQSLNQHLTLPAQPTDGVSPIKPCVTYAGAQISTLQIIHSDYDDLVDFLYNRTEIARDPDHSRLLPVFDTLELCLEPDDVELLRDECKSGQVQADLLARDARCVATARPHLDDDEPLL
ncbi:hypothetical protein HYDPIDRAFT_32165 [Hydnomerulius pinastri MD-312]|uniref:F-box domain-containing protein n=1 Tax=Hydnomerulius pinastri MD-312 TaxID=994086 RepID=A0A0C9V4R9_9AGAM|nr:hypothetical protein HYDPIDRAFT_32165 [Hydnomerulius pinastri MD-312]